MKKLLLFLLLMPVFAIAKQANEPLQAIYQNTLVPNVEQAMSACNTLQHQIDNKAKAKKIRRSFGEIVNSWKRVEALYVWGDYDSDTMDYPRYIDIFNQGNEDINEQIVRRLNSDEQAKFALFKNSFKSINALEVVLYHDKKMSDRDYEFANIITTNICSRLDDIAEVQTEQKQAFLADKNKAMALLLNALIDSSYKVREWRVGAASGLSRKYQGNLDEKRVEYYHSEYSLAAVVSILSAHEQILGAGHVPNFATLAASEGAGESIRHTQQVLGRALDIAKNLKDKDLKKTHKVKPLFESLGKLQDAYYDDLLQSLDVAAKIIEADSD